MPWAAAAAAVGAAGISYAGQQKAAKGQAGAAGEATGLAREQFQRTEQMNAPFYQGGVDALQILQRNLPGMTEAYDPTKLLQEPGYQFGLAEGQKALERSLAARGAGGGGAALKAAARYGSDYGTTKLDEAFGRQQSSNQQRYNQLMGLINVGQSSANQTAAAGGQFSAQAGANTMGAADARAAADIAGANTIGSLLNQGASMYGRRQNGGASSFGTTSIDGGGFGTGANHGNEDYGQFFADGGPVYARKEPKVGTRSPLPSGGGGGMSREAVRAALDAASAPAKPAPGSMGALPTNPVTNPGGVRKAQMQEMGLRNGGEVDGPGGPREDAIPARLSDGEHVMDAATVTALGDGDNAKGQEILNQMRAAIKKHHGRAKGNKGRTHG